MSIQRVGSMLTLFFNPEPVHNYDDARRSDTALFARFFWEMLARGVYLPCSQFEAAFVSTAHTEAHIDQTIEAAAERYVPAPESGFTRAWERRFAGTKRSCPGVHGGAGAMPSGVTRKGRGVMG